MHAAWCPVAVAQEPTETTEVQHADCLGAMNALDCLVATGHRPIPVSHNTDLTTLWGVGVIAPSACGQWAGD